MDRLLRFLPPCLPQHKYYCSCRWVRSSLSQYPKGIRSFGGPTEGMLWSITSLLLTQYKKKRRRRIIGKPFACVRWSKVISVQRRRRLGRNSFVFLHVEGSSLSRGREFSGFLLILVLFFFFLKWGSSSMSGFGSMCPVTSEYVVDRGGPLLWVAIFLILEFAIWLF